MATFSDILRGSFAGIREAIRSAVRDEGQPLDGATERISDRVIASLAPINGALDTAEAALLRDHAEFAAHFGHELRNALSSARMAASLLARRAPSKEQIILSRNLDRMRDLLESSSVYRLIRTDPNTERAALPLAQIVRQAWEGLVTVSGPRSVTISLDVADDVRVIGHPRLMRAALQSLISNAVRFTREGSQLVVSAQNLDGATSIEVKDMCSGVPAAIIEALRTGTRIPRDAGSVRLGLGLEIARDVASVHGGTLHAESSPAGCVFRMFVPDAPINSEDSDE